MIWLPGSQSIESPLWKIPLIFTSTALTVLAQTPPPTPPPTEEEMAKYDSRRDFMGSTAVVMRSGYWYKTVYWTNAFCESAVVLAEHVPSPISNDILSLLIRNPGYTKHDLRITPLWLTGCTLMGLGGALRLLCYRTLGKNFTWQLAVRKDHVLVKDGPYSVVRHPSYVGSLMIGIGAALCQISPGSFYAECVGWDTVAAKAFAALWVAWSLFVPACLLARVNKEDAVLRKEFGAEWDTYAQRTRYRLFPFIY